MNTWKLLYNYWRKPQTRDVLVFEPAAFGGKVISYPYYYIKETPAFVFREIENYIQNYPKKNHVFWKGGVLPEAKEIHGAKLLDLNRSKEEILYGFEKKLEAVRGKHEDELREKTSCTLSERKS